jgi:hypothetical protein
MYGWFVVFCVVGYFVATDESAAKAFDLLCQAVPMQLRKWYWMARLHPKNPITNWLMERRCRKMAEELMAEFREQGLMNNEEESDGK